MRTPIKKFEGKDCQFVDGLLRVPEFSRELAIKNATTRSWILRRRIDVVRVGRSVRIPRSEVTRILEEGFTPRIEESAQS